MSALLMVIYIVFAIAAVIVGIIWRSVVVILA